jgi:hypothetical protein
VDAPAKPNPLVAALCGVLAPGAGLLYAGRWRLALAVPVFFWALAVLVPLGMVEQGADLSLLPDVIVGASLSLWVPALVFGVVAAFLAPAASGPRPAWRHPWWIFGFVLVTHAGASVARRQVAEHVVTVVVVDRQLPRLQLDPPAAFVAARRGFDAAAVVVDELVVVVVDQGRLAVGRVLAVEGSNVRVDLGAGEPVSVPAGEVVGRAVRARR